MSDAVGLPGFMEVCRGCSADRRGFGRVHSLLLMAACALSVAELASASERRFTLSSTARMSI